MKQTAPTGKFYWVKVLDLSAEQGYNLDNFLIKKGGEP